MLLYGVRGTRGGAGPCGLYPPSGCAWWLLGLTHSSQCFTNEHSFNPYISPTKEGQLLLTHLTDEEKQRPAQAVMAGEKEAGRPSTHSFQCSALACPAELSCLGVAASRSQLSIKQGAWGCTALLCQSCVFCSEG